MLYGVSGAAIGLAAVGFAGILLTALVLSLGIMTILIRKGLSNGNRRAWKLGVILSILGLILSIVEISGSIFDFYLDVAMLVANGLVLYTHTITKVEDYFVKSGTKSAPAMNA